MIKTFYPSEKISVNYGISMEKDCSFCEKKSHEVKYIFKGKYATICDECVELCRETITLKIYV
jgi:hypothetical protein